ncbi:alpha,alpha-trehalose-phosphate synthase [Parvularcula bermudensis HTCC2503]|uniref:Alpha,alpha-trehalose-phosphate synthase n=1 Tax=Parvularcula bermudensis (strain ATCC BAA-594 / HTCC2503 / KCTC 12087) TaxID=314260 RepID=E0TGW0_PARBH|nr:glucosylglycerol-phosphate synthase [Parvularcula bermudensis]ADM10719.1 alpha,alpha-trehalose-phosphate synthase [Parvularcula bermudensis HTCC2503]
MSTKSKSDLVILYHRQPYEEVVENGQTTFKENKSPNGIVPTLKGFCASADKGTWVAWKQVAPKQQSKFQRRVTIEDDYGDYDVVRLPLSADQVKSFYHVTSKEAFWPVLHSFPWLFSSENSNWDTFREVNRLFAEAACEEVSDDGLIWIHDYNLWLAPYYIRKIKPDTKIAFFHHTPFPSADIFNVLPWREEIVDSLLCTDLLGFHIPRYAENFCGVARALRGVDLADRLDVFPPLVSSGMALSEPTVTPYIEHKGRRIVIDSRPIGTNPPLIQDYLSRFDAGERVAEIRSEIGDLHLIISVGRVDYTKGAKETLEAFDRLLSRRPELTGKVKLMMVCAAAAQGMTIYRTAQREIERLVGSINGKYGTLGWTPIMLTMRPIPFEELVSYFRVADTCWITPVRDGLNLVAKEYIAAKEGSSGALVLSEFAGVAVELPQAILTNPYSANDMDAAIDCAIDMSVEERKERMKALYETVTTWDIRFWAQHVTGLFDELRGKKSTKATTGAAEDAA